jgi:hypothetical protein
MAPTGTAMKSLYFMTKLLRIPAAAFVLGLMWSTEALAAPRIQVEPLLWDFGTATNISEITHDFTVRNGGDAELQINRLVSSCDACLRAAIDKTKIPPGGTAVVHGRLDLRALEGPITRTIAVYCNDPSNSPAVLGLTGIVMPLYQVTPREIALDLSQGQRIGVAEIAPLCQLHAPLSQVQCQNTNIAATISMEASNKFMLTVRASESCPRGRTMVRLDIRSADSNDPPCLVRTFVNNPPDFEVIPAQLRFAPQTEPQMRILWIKQHGAAPSILLDAIPQSDKFHCEIDPDANGFDYRIYVTAWQQDAAAGQTNALILKVRDRNQHEQSVPVPIVVAQTEAKSR